MTMDLSRLKLAQYMFPGRAGSLQAAGAVPSMLAELGDNYDTYHEHVANALERIGDRPDPKDFAGDFDGYAVAVDRMVDLVRAEQILRMARAWRREGIPLGSMVDSDVPLIDERFRLVARAGDDAARASRRGDRNAADWSPPRPDRLMDLGD